jgi:hypothetical protein
MGFLSRLIGDAPAPDQSAPRREVLRVALRDTLNRHGIPVAWIGAETLVTTLRGAQKGIHWRLLIKRWEPELLVHSVAFQQSLINRLMTLDPNAGGWLMGISWQFALPDESICPPMPQRVWTAETPAQPAKAGVPARAATAPVAAAAPTAKANLEQMFAARDAQLKDTGTFERTEPSPLS